jgi:hypothetical protein
LTAPVSVQVQVPVPFPALVTGSGPITINKQNGIWTVGYSVANIQVQNPPLPAAQPTDYVTVWDSVAQTFVNVPLSALVTKTGVLLNTMTASNIAILTDTNPYYSLYNEFEFVFENVVPATANFSLQAQIRSSASFRVTGYINSAGGITTGIDLTQAATMGAGAAQGFSGSVKVFGPLTSATTNKLFRGVGTFVTATNTAAMAQCSGFWNSTAAINGIQFLTTAGGGNLLTGTIKVYGYT